MSSASWAPGAGPGARPVVSAMFEGEPLEGPAGSSVAAALVASGRGSWRDSRDGAPRGLFCGIGVCFDCIVEIDGESGQRACMIPLREGMDVRCDRGARGAGASDEDRADDRGVEDCDVDGRGVDDQAANERRAG